MKGGLSINCKTVWMCKNKQVHVRYITLLHLYYGCNTDMLLALQVIQIVKNILHLCVCKLSVKKTVTGERKAKQVIVSQLTLRCLYVCMYVYISVCQVYFRLTSSTIENKFHHAYIMRKQLANRKGTVICSYFVARGCNKDGGRQETCGHLPGCTTTL